MTAFNQSSKIAKTSRDVCVMYGEAVIDEIITRDCFTKFENVNFDLEDASRSGHPVEFNEERLNQLLLENLL
ncbi:hypothetical protein TNCV_419911 [Trichonephila clavipes]|uniref:Mos1 transposase HTH domain-containing protein n=1 Tax=Trichonephila clavipes TaxID=2585209 RepID=A0A8X6S8E5_TRICX|nr:hypothetical protein TNCV_419911 [Trichonephila clavipes]